LQNVACAPLAAMSIPRRFCADASRSIPLASCGSSSLRLCSQRSQGTDVREGVSASPSKPTVLPVLHHAHRKGRVATEKNWSIVRRTIEKERSLELLANLQTEPTRSPRSRVLSRTGHLSVRPDYALKATMPFAEAGSQKWIQIAINRFRTCCGTHCENRGRCRHSASNSLVIPARRRGLLRVPRQPRPQKSRYRQLARRSLATFWPAAGAGVDAIGRTTDGRSVSSKPKLTFQKWRRQRQRRRLARGS
jgi:hypothetical protein